MKETTAKYRHQWVPYYSLNGQESCISRSVNGPQLILLTVSECQD